MAKTVVKISVSGPGLVVNGPALVVLDALREFGFEVRHGEWAGLNQWTDVMGPPEMRKFVRERNAPGLVVEVEVEPMPWGG